MDKIKEVLTNPVKELNLIIDNVVFEKGELKITVDTEDDTIIDLDLIVKATKVISKELDNHDFIKESYVLDVSSKEKGEK